MYSGNAHVAAALEPIMPINTALQQNLDKVQACARDVERLEERAGQLRNALLQLLVQPSSLPLTDAAGNDVVRC